MAQRPAPTAYKDFGCLRRRGPSDINKAKKAARKFLLKDVDTLRKRPGPLPAWYPKEKGSERVGEKRKAPPAGDMLALFAANSDDDDASDADAVAAMPKELMKNLIKQYEDYTFPKRFRTTSTETAMDADLQLEALQEMLSSRPQFAPLVRVALAYLSMPASSAPTERVWSQGTLTLVRNRRNLKPENAADLIFLKCNARLIMDQTGTKTEAYAKREQGRVQKASAQAGEESEPVVVE